MTDLRASMFECTEPRLKLADKRPRQAVSRRTFVLSGGAALAAAAVGLLGACSTLSPVAGPAATAPGVSAQPAASGRVQLPSYMAPAGAPPPDVPGTDLIPHGYLTYPKTVFQSVATPPGDGGTVTVAAETFNPLIPLDQNTVWQQLNKVMNLKLDLNLAPFSDWAFGKFQALVAGGDLPDITMIPIGGVIPDLPAFLEAKIQDLTPFVSGDAVKEYPNLAALPTVGWRGMVYNNKIFAVPIASSQFYWGLWGHQEVLEARGLNWPRSADEFRQVLKTLTNLQQNKYGIGFEVGNRYAFGLTNVGGQIWPAIYGAPNNWSVSSDGKWAKDWESDRFKAGVQLARDVWADGSFDPNTTYTTPTADQAFETNGFAFRFDNTLAIANFDAGVTPNHRFMPTQNPPWKIRLAPPIPAQSGGKPQYNLGPGNFGLIVLKKADPARIKLLLKVINYIVAPFGSQEYLYANYGVQGQDFTYDDAGNPIRTKQGVANQFSWQGVMGVPAPVLFDPDNRDFAPTMNASLKLLADAGVQDPTVGLYSATNQKQGFLIQTKVADGFIDIVVGRRPMSDYDQLLAEWRSGGGDTIRGEYETAYAASK
jgi:putative aldouronate transport system substrate-binding protein